VLETCDGQEAVERANETLPDVILLDVMMPRMDGYTAVRKLRAAYATRHIPIVMLTAKTSPSDKVQGLEGGANDYVTKPWQAAELMLRVRNVLEWSRVQRSANPLTGCREICRSTRRSAPGSSRRCRSRCSSSTSTSSRPSTITTATRAATRRSSGLAQIITQTSQRRAGTNTDFVGHIGGDDFVVLTSADRGEDLGEEIITEFNKAAGLLYDPADRERGYVEVRNRLHQLERFPVMSVTIALVSTDRMPVTHLAQLIDIAQELKAHGKGIPGSVLVGERRRQTPGAPGPAARGLARHHESSG
jgi:DNA-binding response OmpR family regulator